MALQTSNETYEKPHLCGSATECGSSIGVQTTKDCLECVFRKTHFKELCSFALRSNNTNLQRYLDLCNTTWRCSGTNSEFCANPPPRAMASIDSGLDLSSSSDDFPSFDSSTDESFQNHFREPVVGSEANELYDSRLIQITLLGEPHKPPSIANESDARRGISPPIPMPRTLFLRRSPTPTPETNVEGVPSATQPETNETETFSPSQKIRNFNQTYVVDDPEYDRNFHTCELIDKFFHSPGSSLVDADVFPFTHDPRVDVSPSPTYYNSFESGSEVSLKNNVCESGIRAPRKPLCKAGPNDPRVSRPGFDDPRRVPSDTETRFDLDPSLLLENEPDPRSSRGSSLTHVHAGEIPPRQANRKLKGTRNVASVDQTKMLLDLFKTPRNTFDGSDPTIFEAWLSNLDRRSDRCLAEPEDKITALEIHTSGKPRDLVRLLASNLAPDPNTRLNEIVAELRTRFASETKVAAYFMHKITAFPPIKDNEEPFQIMTKLREFGDLCYAISMRVSPMGELCALNTAVGINPLRRKLPNYLNAEWRKFKDNGLNPKSGAEHPKFEVFASFLKREADSLFADFGYQSIPRTAVETLQMSVHASHERNPRRTNKKCRYLTYLDRKQVIRGASRST